MTEEDRKAALEWVDLKSERERFSCMDQKMATFVKAMLAEPRLPSDPSREMLNVIGRAIYQGAYDHPDRREAVYRALQAHLSAPPKPETEMRTFRSWLVVYRDGKPAGAYEAECIAKAVAASIDGVIIELNGAGKVPV